MLDEIFKSITIDQLVCITLDVDAACDILGLVALMERTEHQT
jgi:hypothetical protein